MKTKLKWEEFKTFDFHLKIESSQRSFKILSKQADSFCLINKWKNSMNSNRKNLNEFLIFSQLKPNQSFHQIFKMILKCSLINLNNLTMDLSEIMKKTISKKEHRLRERRLFQKEILKEFHSVENLELLDGWQKQ